MDETIAGELHMELYWKTLFEVRTLLEEDAHKQQRIVSEHHHSGWLNFIEISIFIIHVHQLEVAHLFFVRLLNFERLDAKPKNFQVRRYSKRSDAVIERRPDRATLTYLTLRLGNSEFELPIGSSLKWIWERIRLDQLKSLVLMAFQFVQKLPKLQSNGSNLFQDEEYHRRWFIAVHNPHRDEQLRANMPRWLQIGIVYREERLCGTGGSGHRIG